MSDRNRKEICFENFSTDFRGKAASKSHGQAKQVTHKLPAIFFYMSFTNIAFRLPYLLCLPYLPAFRNYTWSFMAA